MYDPNGCLRFSEPRKLETACVEKLERMSRLHPVTAQQWAAQGARYVSWVQPGEAFPDAEGREKILTSFGGFAVLFHDLRERDTEGRDRFFDVVSVPDFLSEASASISASSIPFSIVAAPPKYCARQRARLLQLARRAQWQLVLHVLAERPQLARECDERGDTLLHHCAKHKVQDRALLERLRECSTPYGAQNKEGSTAEEIGDRGFRNLARRVWGLAPDLFEDP